MDTLAVSTYMTPAKLFRSLHSSIRCGSTTQPYHTGSHIPHMHAMPKQDNQAGHHDQVGNLGDQGCNTSTRRECTITHCCTESSSTLGQHTAQEETELPAPGHCRWSPFSHHGSSTTKNRTPPLDVEAVETSLESVVLKFHNANCTCCANSPFKILNSIPGVRSPRVNPILLQAEFDLDTQRNTVEGVMNLIRKDTGYTCERITKTWLKVEAIVPNEFKRPPLLPAGVKDLVFLTKTLISISYDANVIGARELLESSFETPLRLAPPRVHGEITSQLRKTAQLTCISSVLTIPILVLSWAPLPSHEKAYGSVSLALATVVQVGVAWHFYSITIRSLIFARTVDMNLLVVLSTTAAYIVSVVSFIYAIQGLDVGLGLFFETSALLVTLILVGRLATAYSCHRAMISASVRSLQPMTVTITNLAGEDRLTRRKLDVRLLQYGDVFEVEPDSPIVTDGLVISGLSCVDESIMTGELAWVRKKEGSSVIAGSINRSCPLLVKVSQLPGSNTIDKLADIVDAVHSSKPKAQAVADRFANYFLQGIVTIAVTAFAIWVLVGMLIQHHSVRIALLKAMLYSITILVVSCPCALGLAVPMVTVIACSVCAKRGMVVKSADVLDVARKVTHVVFDKTGTLTESHLTVSEQKCFDQPDQPESSLLSLALGMTAASKHPVAASVARHVEAQGLKRTVVDNLQDQVWKGIRGIFQGKVIRIGAARWVGMEEHLTVKHFLSQGYTVSCLTRESGFGSELLAIFGLSASIREDAQDTVSQLVKRGIKVSILSGDERGAVQKVADDFPNLLQDTRFHYLPLEKQTYIENLMKKPKTVVLFCGDGINDSAALAQADVGVCISNVAEAAAMAADVVLTTPCLSRILDLVDISRDASGRVQFNFIWSALYNLVAILYAAGAFVNTRLPLAYAGLGELVSVLPIVLVALQMKWKK